MRLSETYRLLFSPVFLPIFVHFSFYYIPGDILFCVSLDNTAMVLLVFLSRGTVCRAVWLVPSAFGHQPYRRGHPEGGRQGADRARHGHRRLSL